MYSCRRANGDSPFLVLASLVIRWNADLACDVRIATCCLNVRPESYQTPNHLTSSFGWIITPFRSISAHLVSTHLTFG